nr:AAA domain-containing protein [Psychrobium sp. MM17-31]
MSYYRDCYQEDSADLNLWMLQKLKAEDVWYLQGRDDLGSGFLPRLPLPTEFAQTMQGRVETYQRERILLYVSFMVVGTVELKGERKQIAAPLLFNEAAIENDEQGFCFSTVNQQPELNETLVELLLPEVDIHQLLQDEDNLQAPSLWTSLLANSPHNINALELLNFPQLMTQEDVKKGLRRKTLSILPVSMLAFVERASSSRGVLHELESIAELNSVSAPLVELFSDNKQQFKANKKLKYGYLPGLLSTPQQKVISIAANAQLGCVSGPPGTGKSYTIAAVAAEHMARGESVLIIANNDAALDVIGDKLEQNFGLGGVSVRAGKKEFLKQLKSYIADLLAGYLTDDKLNGSEVCEKELLELNHSLTALEQRFIKFCKKAIKRGQRLHQLSERDSDWLYKFYLFFVGSKIGGLAEQWQALGQINDLSVKRELAAAEFLSAVKNSNLLSLLKNDRQSLQAFNQAIRSRTSKRQAEMFEDIEFTALFKAFPVWLMSLNSLYRILPLHKEMFDVVIIDEATQCNISSCLPALYRAKRALIVGDTKQLRHYSFLAKSKESQLLTKHQLTDFQSGVVSYRDNSILDLSLQALNCQQQVAMLDEHFRSKPELIDFSNQQFYQNKLKIMQHRPCTNSGYLDVVRVNGERDAKGINQAETNAVIVAIKQQIASDEAAGINHSIGVVSPFRHQAEHIAKAIETTFDEQQIAIHNLRAATPFGFQGEERDIMLIAFSVDNNSTRAAAYLNKADVFNVCITRARQRQQLFVSIDEQLLPDSNLLRKYLMATGQFEVNHSQNASIDAFQQALMAQLARDDIESWPGYHVAGVEVDLLCRFNGKYLALDLIGYPGPWADFFELNTYKVLQRAGIEILPISYGLWLTEPQRCVDEIKSRLNSEIFPNKMQKTK